MTTIEPTDPTDPHITTDEKLGAGHRRELADELAAAGDLRTAPWRTAVEAVPRHLFIPAFFRQRDDPHQTPRETMWEPITAERTGTEEWLNLVYADETWVTQLDNYADPQQLISARPGIPTSSSTLPGLVVMMLEELNVNDGHMNVLEIGTGTGYSTGLLSERLGADRVTSIEVDPTVAQKAADALHEAGYRPNLIVDDGLSGHPPAAPYDRVIATCSARHVPAQWIAQTKPGGQILMTLRGWLEASSGLLRLTITGDGTAQGRFLADQVSFMPARAHEHPPLSADAYTLVRSAGTERPTRLNAATLSQWDGWTTAFIAQLAAPNGQRLTFSTEGDPMTDYLVDEQAKSYAALLPQPDGTHRVRQGGPIALWDAIEDSVTAWQHAGSPGLDRFQLIVAPTAQTISLALPTGDRSWQLP